MTKELERILTTIVENHREIHVDDNCFFCKGKEDYEIGELIHEKDCIVLSAQKTLNRSKGQKAQ